MSANHVTIWSSCLKVIKDNLPIQAYKTWFEPIVPVKLENNVLTIQVPSHFFYEWLEEHYISLLKKPCILTLPVNSGNSKRVISHAENFERR